MTYINSCVVLVIVIIVMDLGLLFSDCVMDNGGGGLTLHTAPDGSRVFRDDAGFKHCTITTSRHEDPDIERDPL